MLQIFDKKYVANLVKKLQEASCLLYRDIEIFGNIKIEKII